MTVLKYTVPAQKPCYDDWEFRIHPGTFLLHVAPLMSTFQEAVAHHQQYHSRATKDSGRYKEHTDMLALVTWLDRQVASGVEVIEWDSAQRDLVWCYASGLIYSRQFASFSCPTCDMEYSPSDGTIAKWAFGQDLAAEGGRRFICPRGHTLYALMEWNS
jgi:hypothetical protein